MTAGNNIFISKFAKRIILTFNLILIKLYQLFPPNFAHISLNTPFKSLGGSRAAEWHEILKKMNKPISNNFKWR